MGRRINIGVFVSKISTLFPLVRQVNLQVNMKAWKIWEDRIDNIFKNDIFIQDEEPLSEESGKIINSFFLRGGIIIQLYSLDDEVDFEYILKDGKLASDEYSPIVENVDLDALVAGGDGLDVKITRDEGIFVSFSRNIVSEEILEGRYQPDTEESSTPQDETRGDTGDSGSPAGKNDSIEQESITPSENLKFFYNLVSFLHGQLDQKKEEEREVARAPVSRNAIFIHGRSIWLAGSTVKIKQLVVSVFKKLGIESHVKELDKQPEFRNIDPDLATVFPDIYYYHQTFPDAVDPRENQLAVKYLNQAKEMGAIVRAESIWHLNVVPLFFSDMARLHRGDQLMYDTVFLLPPSRVGGKKPAVNHSLLQKTILEPLARQGLKSFKLELSGATSVDIVPYARDVSKLKKRNLDDDSTVVLIHGSTLAEKLKNEPAADFFQSTWVKEHLNGQHAKFLKVLLIINVDKFHLQERIKDYTFQMKRVDDKSRDRLKRSTQRLQDKLHAYTHVSKDRKVFEENGFKLIRIDDDRQTEQLTKIFVLDQLLPYVFGKRVSKVYHLVPRFLEAYMMRVLSPLLDWDNMVPIDL